MYAIILRYCNKVGRLTTHSLLCRHCLNSIGKKHIIWIFITHKSVINLSDGEGMFSRLIMMRKWKSGEEKNIENTDDNIKKAGKCYLKKWWSIENYDVFILTLDIPLQSPQWNNKGSPANQLWYFLPICRQVSEINCRHVGKFCWPGSK